jgi:ankyrin repeat protein
MKTFALAAPLLSLALLNIGCGNNPPPPFVPSATTDASSDLPNCIANAPVSPATSPVKYKAAPTASDKEKFFVDVMRDDTDAVQAALTAGFDVKTKMGRQVEVDADSLNVKFDAPDTDPVPALHWAAQWGVSAKTLELLISHGADVKAVDAAGRTALMYAAANPWLGGDAVHALIAAGADPNEVDAEGSDALDFAVKNDSGDQKNLCASADRFRALVSAGVSLDAAKPKPRIISALENRNLGIAKLLAGLGAKVAVADSNGETGLHALALANDDQVKDVTWALRRGVDSHAQMKDGRTALDIFRADLKAGACHPGAVAPPPAGKPTPKNPCSPGLKAIIALLNMRS